VDVGVDQHAFLQIAEQVQRCIQCEQSREQRQGDEHPRRRLGCGSGTPCQQHDQKNRRGLQHAETAQSHLVEAVGPRHPASWIDRSFRQIEGFAQIGAHAQDRAGVLVGEFETFDAHVAIDDRDFTRDHG